MTTLSADGGFLLQSRPSDDAGGRRTFATITCRTCGATDDTALKDKSAGWARRVFKSRGWTVADRPGRHQCPTCARGPRGLGGKSVREVELITSKRLNTTSRSGLLNDSSLQNGVLELAYTEGNKPHGASIAEEIDPGLLQPDRMAEALSHLGHVIMHIEPPMIQEHPPRVRRGHGPRDFPWKHSNRGNALPVSPKPLDLPDFVIPPPPARQFKRKLRGYRFPGDAAYTARTYAKACGIDDPQIGRDYIVWADGQEIGWAPVPAKARALQQVLETYRPVLAEGTAPEPEPTPAIVAAEPVTVQEDPMPAPTLAAVPPSRPTREKLLSIHEKLNAVYLTDGAGRYTGHWSDARIATELDVPIAWVAEERSRVYGEGTDNEASNLVLDKWRRDMTNKLSKVLERQTKAVEELLGINTELEAIKSLMSTGPKEAA